MRNLIIPGLGLIALALGTPALAQDDTGARLMESCMAAPSTQEIPEGAQEPACTCLVDVMTTADVDPALIETVIAEFDGAVEEFRESAPEVLDQIRNECAPS